MWSFGSSKGECKRKGKGRIRVRGISMGGVCDGSVRRVLCLIYEDCLDFYCEWW